MSRYYSYTKEQLIAKIATLESKKNYGLVWDDEKEPENVVLECQNNIPILKKIENKTIHTDTNKPNNILIEGDNYHALQVLNYTHKGQIDVIYIDPPYNTGKKDFKYNDSFVDKEDGYRHSKWLNFMSKRLKLAHNLLKESGLIFISIDDNEVAQLKLLSNDIFGEENFISHLTIQGFANESNDGVMFQNVTEYCLCFAKNKPKAVINKIDAVNNNLRSLNDAPSGLSTRKQMGYTIYYNDKTKEFVPRIDYDVNNDFTNLENIYVDDVELINKGYIPIRPSPRNGVAWRWRWGIDTLLERREELNFRQIKNGTWIVEFGQSGFNAPRDYQEFGTGTSEVKRIFEGKEVFAKPKSVEFLQWILQVSSKPNFTILDFFAGSGTTGHAVLALNKEDGGNRQFILCTNNENDICTDVTYPRLSKVINGYTTPKGVAVGGLGGNLDYYKTDLVPTDGIANISDSTREELTKKAGNMIAIKENTHAMIELNEHYQIFKNETSSKQTAIYFTEDLSHFDELIQKVSLHKTKLYIFSFGKIDKSSYKYLGKNFEIEDIPEPIIEIYKEINKEGIL